jgi:predicted peroxiredoxin
LHWLAANRFLADKPGFGMTRVGLLSDKLHHYPALSSVCILPQVWFGFLTEETMIRRQLLSKVPQLFGLGLLGLAAGHAQETTARKPLKIMMKSAWGSDDPTKAAFPFLHGHALAEAGHEVQIFLLGEAVSVMRKSVASALVPVGWPLWLRPLIKSSPNTFKFTLAELAAAPGAWRKRT